MAAILSRSQCVNQGVLHSGLNLVVLACLNSWCDKLGVDTRTHGRTGTGRQTQTTTIPEGQNWPLVKMIKNAKISWCILQIMPVIWDHNYSRMWPVKLPRRHHYTHVHQGHNMKSHDGVIKWKHFPRYWAFVRRIYRSPVISPHKGQRRGALMFFFICAWTNCWANNWDAGDLRRHCAHYDVIAIYYPDIRPLLGTRCTTYQSNLSTNYSQSPAGIIYDIHVHKRHWVSDQQ